MPSTQSLSLNDQGAITSGQMTREQLYNYPMSPNYSLTDAPAYTQMTETWAGMDVPPAVTTYSVDMAAKPRRIEVAEPDGRYIVQLMYNHLAPNGDRQIDDGLLYEEDTNDASGKLLRKIVTTWELGDYDSPLIKNLQVTDQLGQTTETDYGYRHPTNQCFAVEAWIPIGDGNQQKAWTWSSGFRIRIGLQPQRLSSPAARRRPTTFAALELWREKLDYLQQEQAIVADPSTRFALKKQIEEAQDKIIEMGGSPRRASARP